MSSTPNDLLFSYILSGDTDGVRKALDEGANANKIYPYRTGHENGGPVRIEEWTPLKKALVKGNEEVIQLLLTHPNRDGITANPDKHWGYLVVNNQGKAFEFAARHHALPKAQAAESLLIAMLADGVTERAETWASRILGICREQGTEGVLLNASRLIEKLPDMLGEKCFVLGKTRHYRARFTRDVAPAMKLLWDTGALEVFRPDDGPMFCPKLDEVIASVSARGGEGRDALYSQELYELLDNLRFPLDEFMAQIEARDTHVLEWGAAYGHHRLQALVPSSTPRAAGPRL